MVAYSSPVKLLMPLYDAISWVKRNISALVIAVVSPADLPRLSKINARRLASGIVTNLGTVVKISVSLSLAPSTNAFTVSMPTVAPNVNRVCAKPPESVVSDVVLSLPPPAATEKVTGKFRYAYVVSFALRTFTTNGFAKAALAVPVCLSPEIFTKRATESESKDTLTPLPV